MGGITLDVTMNPDFGQVEADPARVNLTDFETFFPERRPFFVEGSNIFRLNIGDRDELFHSRRIGRAPRRRLDPRDGYFDAPKVTTIQIAEKLSGKTESGWTVGLLHASTARETADIVTRKGDALDKVVEPATQYSLARLQKDFRDGNSAIGAIATGVFRPSDQAEALNAHTNAITGGFDFRHRFWNDNFRFSGYALASHVAGSEDAIAQTQRAPGRYMHRPDADHLTFDPTRTSLSGLSASANFSKISGSFWRYYAGFRTRTPGFETNDIGFMSRADFLVSWAGIGYDHSLPTQHLRQWEMRWHNWRWQTYGGESNSFGSRLSVNIEFLNYWLVADRFTPLKTEIVDFGYEADVDGDGTPELIRNPDFNFKQFRSNVVLRWEYRLGSTLFVVWSQERQHIDPMGEFNLGSDIGTLFDTPAENVFMIKLNYWLNPHEVLEK